MSPSFLDFSTLRAREAACRREVELNRRLAPDVYEGVADVTGPDGEVSHAVLHHLTCPIAVVRPRTQA